MVDEDAKADADAFKDWLADTQRDDPLGFEIRTGEGWTTSHWHALWLEETGLLT